MRKFSDYISVPIVFDAENDRKRRLIDLVGRRNRMTSVPKKEAGCLEATLGDAGDIAQIPNRI